MNNLKSVFLLSMISLTLLSQAADIEFIQNDWEKAMTIAGDQDKLIFVDAYTTWCGPCKWMDKNVFVNDTVAEFFNEHFINAKLDMEKGEGLEFAKTYNVRAYPSFLWINAEGEVVHRTVGGRDPSEFVTVGKTALDPIKNLKGMKATYADNPDQSAEWLMSYIDVLGDAYEDNEGVINSWFEKTEKVKWTEEGSWKIIKKYIDDVDHPQFAYLVENRDKFIGIHDQEEVDNKIVFTYKNSAWRLSRAGEEGLAALNELRKTPPIFDEEKSRELADYMNMTYFEATEEWEDYFAISSRYVDEHYAENSMVLNQYAWTYFEVCDDPEYLQTALSWANKSVEIDQQAYNTDTQAALLYKLGKKNEAIEAEKEAIELAHQTGEDASPYEDMLDKMMNDEDLLAE